MRTVYCSAGPGTWPLLAASCNGVDLERCSHKGAIKPSPVSQPFSLEGRFLWETVWGKLPCSSGFLRVPPSVCSLSRTRFVLDWPANWLARILKSKLPPMKETNRSKSARSTVNVKTCEKCQMGSKVSLLTQN